MTAPHRLVVGLSFETWGDTVRREFARPPDRFMQYVWDRPDIDHLLVVNPWRSVFSRARRELGPLRDAAFPTSARHDLLRAFRLRRADPVDDDLLAQAYSRLGDKVAHRISSYGPGPKPHLLTYNPFLAAYSDASPFASVTYMARDDWGANRLFEQWRTNFETAYTQLRQRHVKIAAVSDTLLERLAPTAAGTVVPNGVDPSTWEQAQPATRDSAWGPGPLLVYAGNIDGRVSLERVQSVLDANPSASIVFAGDTFFDMKDKLESLSDRVFLVGRLNQASIASLVAAADVCLVPHVVSDLTRTMSPLKLYEYVASGKPVVATDLPPMRGVADTVSLVAPDQPFGEHVARALASAPMSEVARRTFVRNNSWKQRCAMLLDFTVMPETSGL